MVGRADRVRRPATARSGTYVARARPEQSATGTHTAPVAAVVIWRTYGVDLVGYIRDERLLDRNPESAPPNRKSPPKP